MASESSSVSPPFASNSKGSLPVVLLVVGMAGTGKTTLVNRLQHYTTENGIRSYFVNLDPAVSSVSFNANIDICDTVSHKEVMKQYRLGPNGAIMSSLNLFATKFPQAMKLIEQRKDKLDWIIVDTPGQIEVFTWSASGQLIVDSFSSLFPTIILFVADATRCLNPQTFMSTMLYSSSIMLKHQIPLVLVFNKTDIVAPDVLVSWMKDDTALADAVNSARSAQLDGSAVNAVGNSHMNTHFSVGETYAGTLVQSLSLFVHEYYENIPYACVSAANGIGMDDLKVAVEQGKKQSIEEKLPVVEKRAEQRRAERDKQLKQDAKKFLNDVYDDCKDNKTS